MRIFLTLFFFLLFASPIIAEDNRITVELDAENTLYPFYVAKLQKERVNLDETYLQFIEEVLQMDLNRSGKATLLPVVERLEKQLESKEETTRFAQNIWEKEKAAFVILPRITSKTVSAEVFIVHSSVVHSFKDITITGNAARDRTAIHQLSDLILERIFGERGIASSHILYTKTIPRKGVPREQWTSEIWETDYDGNNAKKVISDGNYNLTPIYLPNNGERCEQILFVSYLMGQPKIFLSTITGNQAAPLIHLRGNQLLPAFSREADKIAFISDASGRADLFLQHFHPEKGPIGKPIQLFSYPRSVNASPTFSPDGKKIAFVSDKDWTPRIYLIEADHKAESKEIFCLTEKNRENTSPSWSPDGKKIAYSAKTNGVRQIWIYDFETRQELQITSGKVHKENPSFAPNSLHIVYNTVGEESDLYIVDLNQKKPIRITSGSEINHYPSWEPKQK